MATTPAHSAQYLIATTLPVQGVSGAEWGGALKASIGTVTFTAAGTGELNMIILPAGKKIIYPYLSHIFCPAGTATSNLSVGHGAYRTPAAPNTVVAADPNAFLDAADVGGGEIDSLLLLPAIDYFILDSIAPVLITATFDTADSPAAGTMALKLVWAAVGK